MENVLDRLVRYIRKNLKKGYTKDSLRVALSAQGYSRYEVERALKRVDLELAKSAPLLKDRPKIRHEVFDDEGGESFTLRPKKSLWRRWFG